MTYPAFYPGRCHGSITGPYTKMAKDPQIEDLSHRHGYSIKPTSNFALPASDCRLLFSG